MNNNHLFNFCGLNISHLTLFSDDVSDASDVSGADLLCALNIPQLTGSDDKDMHLLNVSHLSQFTNATGPQNDQDVVHESISKNTSSDLDSWFSNSSSLAAIISNMDVDLKDHLLTFLFEELKKKSNSSERLPIMSIVASILPNPILSMCMGFQISSREFRNARLHAKMYGAGSSLPEKIRFKRNRLDEAVVTHFIEWCNKADIFQNMAFGQKMVHYSNGVHIAIESIKTRLCKAKIQEAYAKEWEEEEYENHWIEENVNVDAEEGNSGSRWNIGDRCCACCPKSKVQCFKQRNHDGRHLFTPKTRLSPSKVSDIISQLTSGDIESLRGVDIVDTECGYENFSKMREIVQSLIEIGRFGRVGSPEGKALIDDIDKVETFHKVGYPQHLGIEGSLHLCTCFECGFQEPCEKKHIGACDECVFSFCVFDRMFKFWEQIDSILRDHKDYEACAFLQDDMEFWYDRIEDCLSNFLDYRRHIAQTEDEAIYDARFYAELPGDESVLIIDYKMKILASLFRESTRAWYGKKGFSCFGALIILPSAEKEFRKVAYHLFFSDDTTQDTPCVNTIKSYIYREICPLYGIKKIHCRADGAGCFSSVAVKVAMPLWDERTGVTELTYKHNVPGKGKTGLDGQFGVLSHHLKRLVDEGNSFGTCDELVNLLRCNRLNNTFIHQMDFQRNLMENWTTDVEEIKCQKQLKDKYKDELESKRYYLLKNVNGNIIGFQHSRHGNGKHLTVLDKRKNKEYEMSDPRDHVKYSDIDIIRKDCFSSIPTKPFNERKVENLKSRITRKNEAVGKEHIGYIEWIESLNLYCCGKQEHTTGSFCVAGPFRSKFSLHDHKCKFQKHSSSDKILASAVSGKWTLSMGCGSIPNRDRASSSYQLKYSQMVMPTDIPFANHLISVGGMRRDNKNWGKTSYRGTKELIRDLEAMFLGGKSVENDKTRISKYTAAEAVARLANMKDMQGRRKYRKSNKLTGPLPTEIYVRQKFSQMKSAGVKGLVEAHARMKDEGDFVSMNTFQKRECFYEFFQEECTEVRLKQKLLEIDDQFRGFELNSGDYGMLDIESIDNELIERGIQYDEDSALNRLLSLHKSARSNQFVTSMRLSNSAEEQYQLQESGNREDSTTNNEEDEDYKNRVMKMTVKELRAERRRRGIPDDGIYLKKDIQNQILNRSHQ